MTEPSNPSKPLYQWDPIPDALSDDGFRLLELLPPTPESPSELRCKIHNFLLDDHYYFPESQVLLYPEFERAPRFAALSYCWGEDVRGHHLLCDGAVIPITESLAVALDALVRLRSRDLDDVDDDDDDGENVRSEPRRFLWVDAICIDQSNLAERRQQVRLMSRIFSKAEKTLVWLGNIDDPQRGVLAEKAMHAITVIDQQMTSRNWRTARNTLARMDLKVLLERQIGADYEVSLAALQRLFEIPWSSRAWIVQEFTLSRKIEVHFGNHILEWKNIVDAARAMSVREGWLRELVFPFEMAKLPALLSGIKDLYVKGYSLQLFDLLQCLPYRIASDPRDLIYSLLGLATGPDFDRHGISPEYGPDATSSSVFLRVAYSILYTKRNLQILECANMFSAIALTSDIVFDESLPSWVPNWEIRTTEVPFLQHNSPIQFNAGGGLSAFFMVAKGNRLILKGILEPIVKCSKLFPKSTEPDITTLVKGIIDYEDFATKFSSEEYFNGQCTLDAYLQTMLPGRISDIEASRKKYKTLVGGIRRSYPIRDGEHDTAPLSLIKAFAWASLLGLQMLFAGDSEFDTDYEKHISGRRLAWSSRKTLSMVPQTTIPGGKLFISQGARLPFIVRPLENGEYHLIGPAYAHGYMNGEAWTRSPKLSIEQIVLA